MAPALGIGAFAEKALVAAGQCTRVDSTASPAAAGLLGCGVMAGFGAAVNTGGVGRGAFQCPYHAWTYGLDVVAAPNLTRDRRAARRPGVENFMECYHCATIHPELIEVLPEFADGYAAQYYVGHGAEFGEDVQGFTVDGSEGLDRIPGVADDQDRRYYAITVRPQVFINLVPDHVIFHRMYRWHPTVRSSSATGCTCRTSWRAARTWTGR